MGSLAILSAAFASTAYALGDCNVLNNVAFDGYDIAYSLTTSGDWKSCLAQCQALPLCTAISVLPGGRCFLKTAAGPQQSVQGAVSCSYISHDSPSKCPLSLTPCPSGTPAAGACAMYAVTCTADCPENNILCPDGTCLQPGSGWANCPSSSLPAYMNTTFSLTTRSMSVVAALTLDEIAEQMNNRGYGTGPPGPPGIARMSLPPYNWLNEGLHGVARSGLATSFPQISVTGCTFNRSAFWWMGRVLGLEARAKHVMYARQNGTDADYTGVTYYAPNINLGRDPRWGRIQEVPTEDPTLMAAYGVGVVLGAQSDEDTHAVPPSWLVDSAVRGTREGRRAARAPKLAAPGSNSTSAIIACCKHAVAYSVENYEGVARAAFNSIVSGADLLDSYFPAFQSCFMEGGGRSSMCSYNAVNGVPTCASAFLLNTTIRQRYGRGDDTFIMSDYGAIGDTWGAHHYCASANECIAKTVINGVDQDGGAVDYAVLPALVANGTAGLTEADVRAAATRLFRARISLGILDPPGSAPWSDLDVPSLLDTDEHRAMSLDVATQGIVLLANNNKALPLALSSLRKVAVIGPNADVPDTLYGNYQGTPPYLITPRAGMVDALGGSDANVYFAAGCADVACANNSGFAAAVAAASQPDADAVLLVLGIDQSVEREGTDRTNITLPGMQIALAQAVCMAAATRSVPCIVVYISGGPIGEAWPLTSPLVSAVLLLGYASQSAGTALANVILGVSPPAGKLAVTWPASVADLPPMGDMGMRSNASTGTAGRTYRFSTHPPLLPFGHGLTYTTWSYTGLDLPSTAPPCSGVPLSFTLTNTGSVASAEVVQVYVSYSPRPVGSAAPPQLSLAEFDRVWVPAGGSVRVNFTLTPHALALVNATSSSTFGQDFGMDGGEAQSRALTGEAYGMSTDYHALSQAAGTGPIGWDDMFFLPTGVPIGVWAGSGQPGQRASLGLAGSVTLSGAAGSGVNLAQCDLD